MPVTILFVRGMPLRAVISDFELSYGSWVFIYILYSEQQNQPVSCLSLTQESYESAQRRLLRQLSSYTESLEPYPRLFVPDFTDSSEAAKVRQTSNNTLSNKYADLSLLKYRGKAPMSEISVNQVFLSQLLDDSIGGDLRHWCFTVVFQKKDISVFGTKVK